MLNLPDIPCFYDPTFSGGMGSLPSTEAHHAIHVLRLSTGDSFLLTSGKGQLWTCTIRATGRTTIDYTPNDQLLNEQENPYQTILACGVLGSQTRMEWMVEKLVELGFAQLWFYTTSRTGKKRIKIDRLNKVAIAAIKQSRKSFLPDIKEVKLQELFEYETDTKLIAVCDGGTYKHLVESRSSTHTLMVIGPEGDFSEDELDTFSNNGFEFCSLGKERLRSETAAVYSLISLNQKNFLNA